MVVPREPMEDDRTIYKVVVNQEEQYAIWPAERENPPGWRNAGMQGRKDQCLTFIDVQWTDMRPLSLRARSRGSKGNPRR